MSVDPLAISFPWYTPYQFAGNMPISHLDLDGAEEWYYLNGKMAKEVGPYNIEGRKKMGLYSEKEIRAKIQYLRNTSMNYKTGKITNLGNGRYKIITPNSIAAENFKNKADEMENNLNNAILNRDNVFKKILKNPTPWQVSSPDTTNFPAPEPDKKEKVKPKPTKPKSTSPQPFCPCWCSKSYRCPCWSYDQQANMTSNQEL